MRGIKTITVLPFELQYKPDTFGKKAGSAALDILGLEYTADRYKLGKFITVQIIKELAAYGFYEVIDYSNANIDTLPDIVGYTLQSKGNYKSKNKRVPDAFIGGEIKTFSVDKHKEWETEENKDGEKKKVQYYYTDVALEIPYIVLRSSDSKILLKESQQKSSGEKDTGKYYPSEYAIAEDIVKKSVKTIVGKIHPRQTVASYELEKDKSDDPRMEIADKFVKNNNYAAALPYYQTVYKETGNEAAGYNAAILLDATGEYSQAVNAIENFINSITDPKIRTKAVDQLVRMHNDIQDRKLMESYLQGE
ncbi:tetratricopeptide repeat protein [Endomicrobium proavitum]|nr:tetratricopeptide repeat protein [Endomicrobium proavitum]